jgi:anti-anti-sigma factor
MHNKNVGITDSHDQIVTDKTTVPNPDAPNKQASSSPELHIRISFRVSGTPTALLTLTGNILQCNLKLLRSAFNVCLTEEKKVIIVDMTKIDIVSSAGWGYLIAEQERLKTQNVKILLCGLQADILAIFNALQLDDILKAYSTIKECQKGIESESVHPKIIEPESVCPKTIEAEQVYPKIIEPVKEIPLSPQKSDVSIIDTKTEVFEVDAQTVQNVSDNISKEEMTLPVRSMPEKIASIISLYGPCSPQKILSFLRTDEFGSEKIGLFQLNKVLKAMDLDSLKKRERFFRSC